MEISVINKLTRDGQELTLSSPTNEELKELLSFLENLKAENKDQRTLVGDYPVSLSDMSLMMKQVSSSQNDLLIIAKLNSVIVGLVDFYDSTMDGDPHPVAEIGVSVLKSFQGLGIATMLMEACIGAAKKHSSIKMIILTVVSYKVEAKRIYTKLGFIDTAFEETSEGLNKYWMELGI